MMMDPRLLSGDFWRVCATVAEMKAHKIEPIPGAHVEPCKLCGTLVWVDGGQNLLTPLGPVPLGGRPCCRDCLPPDDIAEASRTMHSMTDAPERVWRTMRERGEL